MRYFFLGLICGIIINFMPIWSPSGSLEIFPEWYGNFESINNIEQSPYNSLQKNEITLVNRSSILLLSPAGELLKKVNFGNHLVATGKNSSYYALYDKISTYVELFNTSGDKFWRIKSREYPYITSGGKIILLLNGDHSKVRILSIDGNPTGAKEISGLLCTVISFPQDSDFSGIGFINGSYFVLNGKGEITNKGITPGSSIIKGISISNNGKFATVHYGNNKGDFLRLVNTETEKHYTLQLNHIHLTKTALNVTNEGIYSAIDRDRVIICRKDEIQTTIKIPAKDPGLSALYFANSIYFASYMSNGQANLLAFLEDGTFIFQKKFTDQTFIDSGIYGNVILLRGSENLYCYSYSLPGTN